MKSYFQTQDERDKLEEIIREAGRMMKQAPVQKLDVKEKTGWGDFVTQYDVLIQQFLQKELAEAFPEANFMGEEVGCQKADLSKSAFIVDPIDGTFNFVRGLQASSISIGYAYAGEIRAGYVYEPWRDELFTAIQSEGAYCNGEQIHCSSWPFRGGVASVGGATYYHDLRRQTDELFDVVRATANDIRRFGSAALEMCYVACGRLDLYCETRLQPWDYAAASLIVNEAGGQASDFSGRPLPLDHQSSVLGANPTAHREFIEIAAGQTYGRL